MFNYPFLTISDENTHEAVIVPLDKILWVTVKVYEPGKNATVSIDVPGKTHEVNGAMGAKLLELLLKVEWVRSRTMDDLLRGR
jgi:hypothetical protein